LKIRNRYLTKFLACRKKFIGNTLEKHLKARGSDQDYYVLCVWHDALLVPTFAAPDWLRKRCCCLVSQHRDGSYLADAMSWLDFKTVRGSSRKGAAEALREMITDTAGYHIIVTPDGPIGPRRQMKVGAVYVASQTGRALVPGAFVAKRGWRIKGRWTDLLVPCPFTTVYIIVGEPVKIPQGVTRNELTSYVDAAQRAMDDLNAEADRIVGQHQPAVEVDQSKAA
jgi:lysophospholipid acyltransferase (LPLAT)-like uncharacterized protein